MTSPRNGDNPVSPRPSFFAELDNLVLREMEALGQTRRRRPRSAREDAAEDLPQASLQENVIDAATWRQGRAPVVPEAQTPYLLSEEDEAFVARTVDWLKGRPNADQLLEEVWRLTLPSEDDHAEPEVSGDAEAEDQLPGPRLETAKPTLVADEEEEPAEPPSDDLE